MGLVALLPGLAAARPPPDSKTFESLCAIHAPATGPHDISKDEYGEDEFYTTDDAPREVEEKRRKGFEGLCERKRQQLLLALA